MCKYSLEKYPSSLYLDDFNSKELKVNPPQEAGLYRFHKGEKVRVGDTSRGYTLTQLEQMRHRGIVEIYLSKDVEHAFCKVGPEDRSFGVRLATRNGCIEDHVLDNAKNIISRIVEMDVEAREKSYSPEEDHEETLAYIEINGDEVELHYVANTVNTEWGVYFRKDVDNNWCCEGLG